MDWKVNDVVGKLMKRIILFLSLIIAVSAQVSAETRYVTDRILLGIHTSPDAKSALIKSVPSGTKLDVIETLDGFLQVRLEDGTEGWVSAGFVMEETPATRRYDVLAHQYEQTTEELDKLKADYVKTNRELQVRRDQVSNANTTIKELKKSSGSNIVVDPEMENKLKASLLEIEKLKAIIEQAETKPDPELNVEEKNIVAKLEKVKIQNDIMQQRIEVALAHLNGERMPTAEELASIRPQFPTWYWTLLAIVLLSGIIAGYFIMDYRFRRRHGGFRI